MKYFPHGSFLSAKVGSNLSFVWRSFLAAKDLLLNGVCWKVGNGSSLDVWSDRWTVTPLTRGSDFSGVQRVANLIDVERGMWNEEVVERVFDAQSAARVKKIPLLSG